MQSNSIRRICIKLLQKISVTFALISLLSRNHAVMVKAALSAFDDPPSTTVRRDVPDFEKLTRSVGSRVREALSQVLQTSNRSESVRISYILRQVDEDVAQHKLISKIATVNNAVLRVQLVAMNLGYDLLTPVDQEDLDRSEITTAVALLKMYHDLATVEVTDRILANASFVASERLLESRTGEDVLADMRNETRKRSTQRKLLDEWLREIVAIVEREPKIKMEFAHKRREAECEVGFRPLTRFDYDNGLKSHVLDTSLFRRTTLCKQFLKLAFQRANKAKFLFARAVYQLARRPNTRVRVNEAFQKGLEEVSSMLNTSRKDTYKMLREKLFLSVAGFIAQDVELNTMLDRAVYALDVRFKYEEMRDAFAPF